jgi:hypothetical protein
MTGVPFHVFRNSYCPFTWSFNSLWSQMRFVVEAIIIGGGLGDFLGTFFSGSTLSAWVVSVSISVVLRGVKVLLFISDFGGRMRSWDWFGRFLCCLRGVTRDMPLASLLSEQIYITWQTAMMKAVAARSKSRNIYARFAYGSWVRIPLVAWLSGCVYSVFRMLCIYVVTLRPADPRPRCPTDCE